MTKTAQNTPQKWCISRSLSRCRAQGDAAPRGAQQAAPHLPTWSPIRGCTNFSVPTMAVAGAPYPLLLAGALAAVARAPIVSLPKSWLARTTRSRMRRQCQTRGRSEERHRAFHRLLLRARSERPGTAVPRHLRHLGQVLVMDVRQVLRLHLVGQFGEACDI